MTIQVWGLLARRLSLWEQPHMPARKAVEKRRTEAALLTFWR